MSLTALVGEKQSRGESTHTFIGRRVPNEDAKEICQTIGLDWDAANNADIFNELVIQAFMQNGRDLRKEAADAAAKTAAK